MVGIGGKVTAEGEKSKSKAQKATSGNDRAEDGKLENFAEGNTVHMHVILVRYNDNVYGEVCESTRCSTIIYLHKLRAPC